MKMPYYGRVVLQSDLLITNAQAVIQSNTKCYTIGTRCQIIWNTLETSKIMFYTYWARCVCVVRWLLMGQRGLFGVTRWWPIKFYPLLNPPLARLRANKAGSECVITVL